MPKKKSNKCKISDKLYCFFRAELDELYIRQQEESDSSISARLDTALDSLAQIPLYLISSSLNKKFEKEILNLIKKHGKRKQLRPLMTECNVDCSKVLWRNY